MRILGFLVIAALGACATATVSRGPAASGGEAAIARTSPSPFPQAPRGSALPPPALSSTQPAPPEGVGAGGIDFGAWRNADPALYASSFQSQISARYRGRETTGIRSDLQANGFACEDVQRLDCRIEISEQQCVYDWYVVIATGRPDPVAGFEKVCPRAH
jgi:hypothetical protein